MKKILAALDYNEDAHKVADAAMQVAKAMGAQLVLAHVIAEPAYYALNYSPLLGYQGGYTDNMVAMTEDIKKEAGYFLNTIASYLGDTSLPVVVLEGEVEDALLDYAENENADMIVMGSHRHHGIDRILSPDLAVHLIKHAKVPVMAIPTGV